MTNISAALKGFFALSVAIAAVTTATAGAAPATKQNGKTPVLSSFTPICAMPAYLNYGDCNGSADTFSDVGGRIDAVQPKAGTWNLDLTFTHLRPGVSYTLWGNQSGVTPVPGSIMGGFFAIDTSRADTAGTARFSYQTRNATNLGFDLNTTDPNVTIVTSWWSGQWLQILNSTGALYAQ